MGAVKKKKKKEKKMTKAGGRGCRDVGREIIGRNAGDKGIEGKKKKEEKEEKRDGEE